MALVQAQAVATLQTNLGALVNNPSFSDVTFVVGENREIIHAHAVLLSIRSMYFQRCLTGGFAEAMSRTIVKPNCTSSGFRCLLEFLYTGRTSISESNALELLSLSNELDVPELKVQCCEFLGQCVTVDDVCELFDAGMSIYNVPDCGLALIDKYTEAAFETAGFVELSAEAVLVLVQRDELRISELALWRALVRWARHHIPEDDHDLRNDQHQLQTLLQPFIPHVRFLLLPLQEFHDEVQLLVPGIIPVEVSLARYQYEHFPAEYDDHPLARPRSEVLAEDLAKQQTFFGTSILTASEQAKVARCCQIASATLLYKASRDGSSAAAFHSHCDNKGATLTVVQTDTEHVFAALNTTRWQSSLSGIYIQSKDNCLVGIRGPYTSTRVTRIPITSALYGSYSHVQCGPMFGDGDLVIGAQNTGLSGTCDIGKAYRAAGVDAEMFAGAQQFTVRDYEVWAVQLRT
eukprot:TRINITY_DN3594_c0_g1_i2.p1 TRINITY_DN3594_c0_g1~~TRINITY_DN3594_c0_g1_i2.p1  ORF type:complete len:474 (-),score=99.63 TRINITY_DN3594_c0_g1_i2:1850-3235(-)